MKKEKRRKKKEEVFKLLQSMNMKKKKKKKKSGKNNLEKNVGDTEWKMRKVNNEVRERKTIKKTRVNNTQ